MEILEPEHLREDTEPQGGLIWRKVWGTGEGGEIYLNG